MLEANKYITEDLSVKAYFGANQMTRQYHRNVMQTQGGMSIPNFFNLANTTDPISVDDYMRKKRINSLYGLLSFGYKSMLYLDLTLRNDWSSTLPEDKTPISIHLQQQVSFSLNFKPSRI